MNHLILKIVIVLLVIYAVGASVKFLYFLRISKNLVDTTTPFQYSNSSTTKKLLILGDSTAVGIGTNNNIGSIPQRIMKDFPLYSIENKGVSGAKFKDVLTQARSIEPSTTYDAILVQAGGNDIVRFTSEKKLHKELVELLELLKPHSENIIFVASGNVGVAPIFPKPLHPIYTSQSKKVFSLLSNFAQEKNVIFIDLYIEPSQDVFKKEPQVYFAPDKFHPSAEGYGVWYSKIAPILKEKL